ncbi:TraR/DksA family transcriptional regulator [Limnobaculum xujianqingii]|uniref:TraR/DksA family transcriptional regulator n=1 Tax=Limnobaculum xujianqingii TaxID=2738837 RepID=UPI0011277203|nr:TraR/DksA family transcriptional regulator [Limnobaculum xujianqingii]
MDDIDRAAELELQQQERALEARKQSIPAGTGYSHCFGCDNPIPEARRKAIPGVTRCVDCQQIHEIWGRK